MQFKSNERLLKDLDRPKWCSAKLRHRFAYQWLDKVKIKKIYTKSVLNIQCSSSYKNFYQLTTTGRTGARLSKRLLRMSVVRQC